MTEQPVAAKTFLEYKWRVLISVIFGVFMVILDSTAVNVALRTLQEEFGASTSQVQWIISVYTLLLGIATPIAGFLADRLGIKRIYTAALLIFVLGSLLSGLAPTLPLLIAARALQGIGGGLAIPLGTAMLFGAFPLNQRGLAFGIFGIALVFAPAIGPLLGGWLVDLGEWRWIFYINLPIGVLGFILASRFLREQDRLLHQPLPLWSVILSTIGFGAFLYGASLAGEREYGWTAPVVLAAFAAGLLALIAFVIAQLRSSQPLLDLRLFALPTFLIANLIGWISIIALFGSEFLMPLYLQVLRGQTALEAGLQLLPLAIASGFTTPLAGRWFDKIGPRPLVVTGFGLIMFNTWQFSQLTLTTDLVYIALLLAIRGIGIGLVIQSTQTIALRDVPVPKLPRATSLINASRQLFQSLGVAVLATILANAVTVQGPPPNVSLGGAIPPQIRPLVEQFQQQYLSGLEHAYLVTFFAAIGAFLLAFLLPGWPARYHSTQPDQQNATQLSQGSPIEIE